MWEGERSNHSEAERYYEEAIALASEIGDGELVSISMINLGVTANEQGDIDRAASLYDEARLISRDLGALEDSALATLNLAECHRVLGRIDEAAATVSEGLSLVRELETERTALQGLLLTAVISWARGQVSDDVARLIGAADALRDRLGESLAPDADLLAEAEQLEVALGRERYERAVAEGRAMSLAAAVDAALASLD
jgi:tetratricopeptide (TPR) repeat protein